MTVEVDLQPNVTLYGQEMCIWCGAASAQMIMNGYPDPAHRIFNPQVDVWNTIQANNSAVPADANWATDPVGLRGCLASLNPPPGGSWLVHASNRDAVMFDIIYWMNRNHYPVATLINRGGHWVVVVEYQSDVAPVAGSTPVLQQITKYDPEPHNVGSVSTMTGANWYATDWNGTVNYAGSWFDKYVAVIEPPTGKGIVKVKEMVRTGDRIISPERALKYAKNWIDELGLSKKPPHAILQKSGVKNLEPLLVREEINQGLKRRAVPHYYLIPFGFERETGACGVPLARLAIIVNAFTGQFEEIGSFGKPVRYLPKSEAVAITMKVTRLKSEEIDQAKVELMYQPSDITHIRTNPFWKVTVRNRTIYIDQLGAVYSRIKPSVPGD